MSRRRCLPLLACAALAAIAPAAIAQDPERVPEGVSAGGVDVSGLTLDEARVKLELALGQRLNRPVMLGAAGRNWKLTAEQSRFTFDALTTAKRAIRAKPSGTRSQAGGAAAGTVVPLAISHSRLAVRSFVAAAARKVRKAPRNARLRVTLRRMVVTRARHGKGLDVMAVSRAVDALLDDEAAPRYVRARLSRLSPDVSVADLRRFNRTVVTVDKRNFTLRLFKNLKLRKRYGVAVGQPAYPTPSGLFRIANKAVNPAWNVPNSPWAGELAGSRVQGGSASNPLKARWMGIVNGVGIHGTGEEWSIGSRASHGCIRMRVRDVIDLYPRVPVGTQILLR